MELAELLVPILEKKRFSVQDEKETQQQVQDILQENKLAFIREHQLSAKDIPDFLIGSVVIEVKIKGRPIDILRQCTRYCQHKTVNALILLTNKLTGFPEEINGKPCYVINMGKAWL